MMLMPEGPRNEALSPELFLKLIRGLHKAYNVLHA